MTTLPPGYYAVPDPDRPDLMTYWRATGPRLAPWPTGAHHGPPPLLKRDRPADPDAADTWRRAWAKSYADWLGRVRKALAADPAGAQKRFADLAVRCFVCGRVLNDATSKLLGVGPDCRRSGQLDPAVLAQVTTPRIAAHHAQQETEA
ncbi:DUF6011 domain-containing protein [Streptomyces sp. URMC 129]|uniref:DUF6011 domain-containing protein n=1 Tax=Streptomyces sp. URMC 129 TaxID=3423407 RepID=UPI003F1DF63D